MDGDDTRSISSDSTRRVSWPSGDAGDQTADGPVDLDVDIGSVLGPYTLLERIGEGGFGSVYLAEQSEPVRRRVALKVLKPGMDTRAVVARFEAERQALARMSHPGVATVLDAGRTPLGRPYFVMEYVPGEPITDFCDQARLTINERVVLFRSICAAIQHAHQKGIIHRDIKPSNVLVYSQQGETVVKVIDFGIAKAIHGSEDGQAYTQMHQLLGTPAYMSPEQAGGASHSVDTRSDVYSMGALLHELLVGTPPLPPSEVRNLGVTEIQEKISSLDHKPLSKVLEERENADGEISQQRGGDASAIRRILRSDLNWIVRRCLEKDPGRRYPSVSAFDEDLRRYLSLEPVSAGPPTTRYLVGKFLQRNRAEAIAAAVLVFVVMLGMTGTVFGWARASQESERLQFTLDFFSKSLAGATDNPTSIAGWTDDASLTLGEALADSEPLIAQSFADQPKLEATIRQLVGLAQLRGGKFTEAALQLSMALELRTEVLGAQDSRTLELLLPIAEARSKSGDIEAALESAETAYDRHASAFGAEAEITRAVALWNGKWLASTFRFSDADRFFDLAVLRVADVPDTSDTVTVGALVERVAALISEGRLDRADATLRSIMPKIERVATDDAMLARRFTLLFGLALGHQGKYDEALRVLGDPDDPAIRSDRVRSRLIAWVIGMDGDLDRSREIFDQILEVETRNPGPAFREIFARLFYSEVLVRHHEFKEALLHAQIAIDRYDAEGYQSDPDRLWGLTLVGLALSETGDQVGAARALERASEMKTLFPQHGLHVPLLYASLARAHASRGDGATAYQMELRASESGREILGVNHPLMVALRRDSSGE